MATLAVYDGQDVFPVIKPVMDELGALAGPFAKRGIELLNGECVSDSSLAFVYAMLVLMLQEDAQTFGADLETNRITREEVLAELCVQVVFHETEGIAFPLSIQPGESGTLNLKVGYRVGDEAPSFSRVFNVFLTGQNVSPEGLFQQQTSATGEVQRTYLWTPDTAQMRIDASACFLTPSTLVEVCQSAHVLRGQTTDVPTLAVRPPFAATRSHGGYLVFYAYDPSSCDENGFCDLIDKGITWSSDGGDVHNGAFFGGETPGVFTVTAASKANPDNSASATVTVLDRNLLVYAGTHSYSRRGPDACGEQYTITTDALMRLDFHGGHKGDYLRLGYSLSVLDPPDPRGRYVRYSVLLLEYEGLAFTSRFVGQGEAWEEDMRKPEFVPVRERLREPGDPGYHGSGSHLDISGELSRISGACDDFRMTFSGTRE